MKIDLINLTPHALNIYSEDGKELLHVIPPSDTVARVGSTAHEREPINGIPFVETVFGEVEGLPESEYGVMYIVSAFVIQAAEDRRDLVRPDTGPEGVIRDAEGKILGVRRLTR
jgi:hypothetical protein